MSMNLGYLLSTAIFAVIFIIAVMAQIKAKQFHPTLYWVTITATTTVGTTLAGFLDRSLGIGYAGGSILLFSLLMASILVWYRTLGTVSVASVSSPKAEVFYWVTIMFSQTLGARRLDNRHRRLWLYWRCHGVWRDVGAGCASLLLYSYFAYRLILGGVYSHKAIGCCGGRFSR